MKYEGLYILDIAGKEEGLKEAIDAIEKEIRGLKGEIQGIQKMDKRSFERVAGKLDAGFYVNFQFELDSSHLIKLRDSLNRNDVIHRQFYLKKNLQEKKKQQAVAA